MCHTLFAGIKNFLKYYVGPVLCLAEMSIHMPGLIFCLYMGHRFFIIITQDFYSIKNLLVLLQYVRETGQEQYTVIDFEGPYSWAYNLIICYEIDIMKARRVRLSPQEQQLGAQFWQLVTAARKSIIFHISSLPALPPAYL